MDSARLRVQKGTGTLRPRERGGEPEGAGETPKIGEGDAASGQMGNREDSPSSAHQMTQRVGADIEHGDDRGATEGKNEKPDDRGPEAQDQSADARRRRAQAAEIDKGYEEKLEGFAHNLQALRQEAQAVDPEESTPLPLDGIRLQSFILSSDSVPADRGRKRLGTVLLSGIACAVVAAIAYYFAVGNPFTSNESRVRPELEDAMGLPAVSEPLSEAGQSEAAGGKKLANAEWPNAAAGKRHSDPLPTAIDRPAEPATSARTSSAKPVTSALASAPASTPVQPQPPARAMMRPSGMDPDEIELLLKKGQEFVAAGDLATARVVLRHAAEAGAAAAAFALAQCYDPRELTKMRARGIAPDIREARRWYEIARQMGSAEAAHHLEALPPE